MIAHRLYLLVLTVLLSAAHTLSATVQKPDRGLVRFASDQHIPIRPNGDAVKTKSSSPVKTKKPTTAQADPKKKTPVKSSVAAATAATKKSSKPVDDKYRSEFEEYMRQQIQQWQIAVVNGQPVSPPEGSQPSGQPPSSVWIQVPANGYYPPPSYPYPPYPQQPYPPPSYPPPSYPPPSYPPPSYPPPSYPQPSYPPPAYPPPSYPPPAYPQPSPYPPPSPYPQPSPSPQPSPYPEQPLYPPQTSPPIIQEPTTSQPETPGVVTPQPESPPASESPAPEPGTPPSEISDPDIPEITQSPTDKPYPTTMKPEGSTELPEVIPAYPDNQQPGQPGIPIYPGQPEVTTTEASTDPPITLSPIEQPTTNSTDPPITISPIEQPTTNSTDPPITISPVEQPTTNSTDPPITISPIEQPTTYSPDTDALKAQCKEPRGQFPSESSCNKFINCWDDTAVEQSCTSGLVFNPEKSYCDYPSNVDCGSKPITSIESGNNTICPDAYGTYRSKENCGSFYVCVAGTPVDFICPGGTNYNDDLKICDYPYRVDCKGLPNNPEPIETGTEIEPITTFAPEVSSSVTPDANTPSTPLTSAESSPVTEVLPTSSTPVTPVADPIAIYNYNLRKVPPSLVNTGVRCSHKSVYRLTPDCSSVTLCRNGFTHILNCGHATSYDIVSQKCMASQRANCGRSA